MAVTLQQIADKAGVSRGTVDRALNNRGRIRPEVAERVRQIAEELGYRPNRAGKALALTRKSLRIGVILQETETPFMIELLKGIAKASEQVAQFGGEVILREIRGINTGGVIEAMEEMREDGLQALAINPAQNQRTKEIIRRYVEEFEIPVATFNTDIEDSGRVFYVGQNAYQCGRAAAGLMAEILHDPGSVAVISGYESNPSLGKRCEGFAKELERIAPEITVLPTRYAYNSDMIAETVTREILEKQQDLRGIFITCNVEQGVCEALRREEMFGKVKLIICDITPGIEKELEAGNISFAIVQNAYDQGYQTVNRLFEMIFDGHQPSREYYYTDLTILNSYNLPERTEEIKMEGGEG